MEVGAWKYGCGVGSLKVCLFALELRSYQISQFIRYALYLCFRSHQLLISTKDVRLLCRHNVEGSAEYIKYNVQYWRSPG